MTPLNKRSKQVRRDAINISKQNGGYHYGGSFSCAEIIVHLFDTIMKNNEGFSECSDNDINLQIFDYVLTKNDDTKNIESFTNNKNKLRILRKSIKTRRRGNLTQEYE